MDVFIRKGEACLQSRQADRDAISEFHPTLRQVLLRRFCDSVKNGIRAKSFASNERFEPSLFVFLVV